MVYCWREREVRAYRENAHTTVAIELEHTQWLTHQILADTNHSVDFSDIVTGSDILCSYPSSCNTRNTQKTPNMPPQTCSAPATSAPAMHQRIRHAPAHLPCTGASACTTSASAMHQCNRLLSWPENRYNTHTHTKYIHTIKHFIVEKVIQNS